MKAFKAIVRMEKSYNKGYITPEIKVVGISGDNVLCVSGNHEGFYEEDWED